MLSVVLLWMWGTAWAQETPGPPPDAPPQVEPDEPPDETIYVYDHLVAQRKDEVEFALRDLGYRRVRSSDGREVFVNEVAWKPQIVFDDDGWMRVKRGPVQVGKPELPGIWKGPLGYAVCVVAPTSCIRVGGLVISQKKLQWHKTEVLESIQPAMAAYEEAVVERAMATRTGQEVPEALDALWERGVPFTGNVPLPDPDQRKAALLGFWLERADNTYGDRVRVVVEDYLNEVVQYSATPVTPQEVAQVNARRTCQRELVLRHVGPTTPTAPPAPTAGP